MSNEYQVKTDICCCGLCPMPSTIQYACILLVDIKAQDISFCSVFLDILSIRFSPWEFGNKKSTALTVPCSG